MQEPYMKGEAAPLGPESRAGNREVAREALTGGSAGQPLSSEITRLEWSADPVQRGGMQHDLRR